jgi:xanthine/uracil/vitamin C permease (AzgA family)
LSYVILKVAAGKPGEVSVAAWFMAAIFTARFVLI